MTTVYINTIGKLALEHAKNAGKELFTDVVIPKEVKISKFRTSDFNISLDVFCYTKDAGEPKSEEVHVGEELFSVLESDSKRGMVNDDNYTIETRLFYIILSEIATHMYNTKVDLSATTDIFQPFSMVCNFYSNINHDNTEGEVRLVYALGACEREELIG